MIISLCQNYSESNRVDKDVSVWATVEGSFRGQCSITDPIITIESADNLSFINYIAIPEYSRLYFVDDIICVRTGLWEFHCHVDVLSSFKDQIRNTNALIARQEYVYNLYLDDDKFLVDSRRQVECRTFPNVIGTAGNSSLIVTIAGGGG